MPLLIGFLVLLGVTALGVAFLFNARVIRRDVDERIEAFQERLEQDAAALIAEFLDARKPN